MALTAQRKQSIHHIKARGEHHSHTKHYKKAYWPYLPMLLLVGVALAVNTLWTLHTQVLGATTSLSAEQLLQSTNQQRSSKQEHSLTISPMLSAAAQAKANDMASRHYWAHTAPDGKTAWTFIKASGYQYSQAGENLAYGFSSPVDVISGWMNSPAHRANILRQSYDQVGFGVVSARDFQGQAKTTIVVAMYGQPLADGAASNFDSSDSDIASASTNQPYRTVSRVQTLTAGKAPWSLSLVLVAVLVGGFVIIYRHSRAWHRLLVRGEAFVLHHKEVDLLILVAVLAGVVVTRGAGFIG